MGRGHDGKGGLAHSEGVCEDHWCRQISAARSASLCRMENYAESVSDGSVTGGFPLPQLGIVLDSITGSLGISRRSGPPDGNVLFLFHPKFRSCPEFVL